MTTTATAPMGWLSRLEAWLDERGKGAWIAAMVLGFVVFWPLGLALLAYMIWGKRMFGSNCRKGMHHRHRHGHGRGFEPGFGRGFGPAQARAVFGSSGNAAFDAYKADTLRRLEDEQEAFGEFLQRLREAKDKAEFDQFMTDRERRRAEDATVVPADE